jgi:short-subunit dehydrogenase
MKKILITGVAAGYGRFMAEKFHKLHYDVAGIDNIPESELNHELRGKLLLYKHLDLSNINGVKERFPTFLAEFFPDILINNAGLKVFDEFGKFDTLKIEQVITVNFLAPIILTKIWIDANPADNQLINVFLSSNAAYRGYKKGSLYCSSKGGLRLFAEAFNDENANNNIVTITLCPETFSSHPSISSKYSMDFVYRKMIGAMERKKSCEVPIISLRSKIKYLHFDILKYLNWFVK